MSRILFFICILFLLSFVAIAQDQKAVPLLDGTSIDYVYDIMGPVHVELSNGQFNFNWAADGPAKVAKGSAPYQG